MYELACDIANPFPPDLWGYVHGFSYWLIYELVMYGKSLSAGPCEVSCIDLVISWEYPAHDKGAKPRSYASGDNIYLWRFSLVTAGARPPGRGGCTRTLRDVQERCYLQERDVQERCYLQEQDAARVRLPIVQSSQVRPFQALPCERKLLRPPSHGCLWRVRTSGCQRYDRPE